MKLTQAKIDKLPLPPHGKHKRIHEPIKNAERTGSLVLTVSYGGTKTYAALYYEDGQARTQRLGHHPTMTLAEARTAAHALLCQPQRTKMTFRTVLSDWLHRHVRTNGLRTRNQIERRLQRFIPKLWYKMLIHDVSRADVASLLDDIEENYGAVQADALLTDLNGIFKWYQARDANFTNPIVKGMRRDKRQASEKMRQKWLKDEEIKALWHASTAVRNAGALCRLALLTAQRSRKIAEMRFADIDLTTGIWTIPRVPREKNTPDKLRLPKIALTIIKKQRRYAAQEWVFETVNRSRWSSFRHGKTRLDEASGLQDWVFHDLRRSSRALLSRIGVDSDIAERVLGHSLGGIRQVYDKQAEYQERIDEALQLLATEIERIVTKV